VKRPNIILFLADDLGWADLACYGSEFYETPNIDAMCARGMLFTDAYAACPVCSPTRGSILTGKYPATLGITDWIDWGGSVHPAKGKLVDVPYIKAMPLSEETIAHALGDAGYQSWHIGKWHLGGKGHLPEDVGFDRNIGGCHMGSPSRGGYFSPWIIDPLIDAEVPDGTYLTDFLTDQAIECIENRDSSRPFFLNMWYYLVHTPIEAPVDLVQKYEAKAHKLGLDLREPFEEGAFFPTEHKQELRIRRRQFQSDPVYAAMVEKLDESVGRIYTALQESGEEENSIIIFSSDNGGLSSAESSPTCNAPLSEGKGWMYEGGVREPLIISWPGRIAADSSCSIPVSSPDLYPTLLEAVGVPLRPSQHCDGVSFVSLFNDPAAEGAAHHLRERPLYWHYPHYGNLGGTPGSVIRRGDWKLLHFFEDDGIELYNLRRDIGETEDVSAAEPKLAAELKQLLDQWRSSIGALVPEINLEYSPWPSREKPHHSA
jgi:arylsulfatase A-like enzyme